MWVLGVGRRLASTTSIAKKSMLVSRKPPCDRIEHRSKVPVKMSDDITGKYGQPLRGRLQVRIVKGPYRDMVTRGVIVLREILRA